MRGLIAIIVLSFGLFGAAWAEDPAPPANSAPCPTTGSSDAVAEFYCGHAALQQGNAQDAIAHFSKALEIGNLEPIQEAYVHHYRAIAYQRLDRQQEAIDDYTQALAIGALPTRVQAAIYYNRAIALDHLANYERAIKDYTQAIALKPDYAEAYMNRGNAYRKLNDNDAALRDYEASAAYGNPIKHLPYYGEGLVLEAQGDKAGALKAFQTALLLAPDFEPAREKVDAYEKAGIKPASSAEVAQAAKQPAPPPAAQPTVVAAQTPPAPSGISGAVATMSTAPVSKPEPVSPVTVASAAPAPAAPAPATKPPDVKPAPPANAGPSALPTDADMAKKPSGQSVAMASADAPAVPQPATAAKPASDVKTASLGSGDYLVQLGAFTSQDIAQSEATEIAGKYKTLLDGLNQNIERADLGTKGVYYRLRFGPFATKDEARQKCSALKAQGQDCIIVANSAG